MKHFSGSGSSAMDVDRSRFPYCVVWTPIPVLTVGRPRASLRHRRAASLSLGSRSHPSPSHRNPATYALPISVVGWDTLLALVTHLV
uniref:Uncharacterized protein n=1 Tax=Ursus americanus TaxID=9643 RepID=A0A452QD74_URSAM